MSVEFNRSCELQSVGKYAFDDCSKLPAPAFPQTIESIEEGAFKGCINFIEYELPTQLKSIGDYGFSGCTGLTHLNVPATTTSIGCYAFSGCTSVKKITFADSEETLALGYGTSKGKGYGLFNDCPLEELYLGRTVSYEINSNGNYGYSPFYKQEALASVTVSSLVKELPYCIFWGNAAEEIYIPSSVRTIHSSALYGCQNLKRVVILGATPPTLDNYNTFLNNSAEASKIYVFFPDMYQSAKVWKDYADKIDQCCEIYSNLTYSGEGHVLGYKTDFPIVLENRDTEAIDAGTYQKLLDVTYETNGYSLKDVLNYEYTIKRAPLTITAKSLTRSYGEENPEFQFVFDGFVNGEDEKVFINEPTATTNAAVNSAVGEYEITVSGAEAKNYEISYVKGTMTIEQAPLWISVGTYTKKEGDPMPEFMLAYEGFKNNETEDVLTTRPTISCEADKTSAPGEYPIVVSGAEAQNYAISYTEGKLIVTEADPVTITANSHTITYGDAIPEFEYTVEGAELDGEPEIVCEATSTSPVGEYLIVIKKGSVTNYNDTYINGVLIIEPAPLTISVQDAVRVYGEENPEFALTFEGFVNEEDETVLTAQPVVQTEADPTSDAGEYALIASGAEAQNYSIFYTNGTLTIEKAPQEIIWEQEFAEEVMTGDTIALTAHSSCDLPVTYVLSNSDVAVLYEEDGNMYLICTGEGTLEIRATQEGDKNHLAAEDVAKTVVVIINGIGNISGDSNERYYRMEGTETESLSKGFYIVITKNADGSRSIKKIFVR